MTVIGQSPLMPLLDLFIEFLTGDIFSAGGKTTASHSILRPYAVYIPTFAFVMINPYGYQVRKPIALISGPVVWNVS